MNELNQLTVSCGQTLQKVFVLGPDTKAAGQIPSAITLERDSRLDVVLVILPGAECDIPLSVRLAGEGCEANVSGLYVCDSSQKVKIAVDMFHDVPHCNSRQLFKGLAAGNSRVDFYGKIVVAKDA